MFILHQEMQSLLRFQLGFRLINNQKGSEN